MKDALPKGIAPALGARFLHHVCLTAQPVIGTPLASDYYRPRYG
jgi:hypothetical protein